MAGFGKRRGQAFETMMLVISVIVAVAILGVLLSFLGGIGQFGTNAQTVMPDLAKKVDSKGYGIEVKEGVQFEKDSTILRNDVKGSSSIIRDNIEFVCAQADFCGSSTAPIEVKSTQVSVREKTTGGVAVCSSDGNKFFVCIAKTSADANKECFSKCRL